MPLQNYRCHNCHHLIEDVFFKADKPTKWKKCPECASRCYPTWKEGFNKRRTLKDLMGTAKWHPQIGYGVDIESVDHFHALCKEMGMEEGNDPVGGNREWRQEELEKMKQRRPKHFTLDTATPEQVDAAWGREGLLEG
jgi:hypothetical protein